MKFGRGKLNAGENVLIHGGTSGIGTTAIQLASHFGANVWATAGSEQKCQFCHNLGALDVVNYNDQNFLDIMQVIKNKSEKAKIPCGIHVVEPDKFELKKKIDDGYKFIPYSIDAVVLQKYIKNPLS